MTMTDTSFFLGPEDIVLMKLNECQVKTKKFETQIRGQKARVTTKH